LGPITFPVHTLNVPSTHPGKERVYYGSLQELIREWQDSGDEGTFWEYLGMSESIFKDWARRSKMGVADA